MNITLHPFDPGVLPTPKDPGTGAASLPPVQTPVQESSSSISPMASALSQLDQIQQQSPAQYAKAASSIAAQLQADATAAQNNGNTAQAKTLTQLATEFQSSAQTGQVPSAQVLQKALAGHHHHHGHHAEAGTTSTSTPAAGTLSLLSTALSNALNSTAS
jgi:hypothetical protein